MTAALAIAGATSSAIAQQVPEARIKELMRQAAARLAVGQVPDQTGAVTPQAAAAARPTVRLTLDDVVKTALDHNLNIVVQRLNPEISDISLASLRSVYLPALTSTLSTQSTITPATTSIAGSGTAGAPVTAGLSTYNGGVTEFVPFAGGSYAITLNNNKSTSTSLNVLYDPTFNTAYSFQYTQPLMKGLRTDANRQPIAVTKINRDISDVQLRATITNTLSNVREAYWNYVFAVQSVNVAQQALDLANQLVKDDQTRVQVGTMAPLDVVTAQSQAATAKQALVAAQSTMRTDELVLKQLIVSGTEDPIWSSTIDPIDRPDFRPEAIDLEAAVRRALSERTDLVIAKKNIQQNDVTIKFLRDQLLPQADLVANYGLLGIGGDVLAKSGTGVNQIATGIAVPGGFSDALSTLFGQNFPRWTVGVNFSYPLGQSSAQATVARARVQQSQVEAQVKQLELQVATDVTNAVVTAESNVERVTAAQSARVLAQQALDAEQAKFLVGLSTNYLVIQQQNALSTAQNNELQSILNYRIALVELDRLQQTTLTTLGVTIVSNATR